MSNPIEPPLEHVPALKDAVERLAVEYDGTYGLETILPIRDDIEQRARTLLRELHVDAAPR